MSGPRKKIAICLSNDVFVRNFIDSGAMSELEKRCEVTYLVSEEVRKDFKPEQSVRIEHADIVARTVVRYKTGYLSMSRFSGRSRSFPLKFHHTLYQHLGAVKKIAFRFLSLPMVYEAFNSLVEWRLGTLPDIDRAFQKTRFDLAVIPSGFSDSFSIDCLKSANRLGIKSLLLMFNWDNVSCKGVLSELPTAMGVWGEQTREQAMQIHGMSRDAVFVLGSPQFNIYFEEDSFLDPRLDAIRERNPGKRILLYLGIARYRDEIHLLNQLEEAIASGLLPNAHILYRPHPWKEINPGEKSFFDCGYKHVTMDPQVEKNYRRLFSRKKGDGYKFSPEYRYMPGLLRLCTGIISSLTTVGIEAMLLGKPLLLPIFPDRKFPFSVDTLIDYEHHQCWKRFPDVLICDQEEKFAQSCLELLNKAGDPTVGQRLKQDAKYVVYYDKKPYSQRLWDSVETLL